MSFLRRYFAARTLRGFCQAKRRPSKFFRSPCWKTVCKALSEKRHAELKAFQ